MMAMPTVTMPVAMTVTVAAIRTVLMLLHLLL